MEAPIPDSGLALAARGLFAIFPVVLLASIASLVFEFSLSGLELPALISPFIEAAVTAFVAFAAHNYVLSGEKLRGFRALQSNSPRSLITFLLLSFLVVALVQLLGHIIAHINAPIVSEVGRFPTEGEISKGLAVAFFLAGLLIVITCAFGTVFPAIVDGGDTSLRAAWQRGTAWPIFWRLIGTVLVSIVLLLFASLVVFPLLQSSAQSTAFGEFSWQFALAAMIMMIINFFMTTLVAVIFSKAYLGRYTN